MRSTDNVTKRMEQLIKAGSVGIAVGRDLMDRLMVAVEEELEKHPGSAPVDQPDGEAGIPEDAPESGHLEQPESDAVASAAAPAPRDVALDMPYPAPRDEALHMPYLDEDDLDQDDAPPCSGAEQADSTEAEAEVESGSELEAEAGPEAPASAEPEAAEAAEPEAPEADAEPMAVPSRADDSGGAALVRSIIDNSNEAFVGMDSKGMVTEWNPTAERIFGWSREEIMGLNVADTIIAQAVRDTYRDTIRRLADGGDPTVIGHRAELSGLHRDGREFPLEVSISGAEGPSGWSFYALIDEVEPLNIEEERRAGLASIVESSDDAMMGLTLTGEITSWNQGAEALFGIRAGEAIGRPISRIISEKGPSVRPFLWRTYGDTTKILERVRRGARVEAIEIDTVDDDGGSIHISMMISPIRNATKQIVGAAAVARDFTARRRAERYRDVHLSVARTLAESSAVEDAMPKILEALCDTMHWDVGAYWAQIDGDLESRGLWHSGRRDQAALEALIELTAQTRLTSGAELPGRAMLTQQPTWVEEWPTDDDASERTTAIVKAGLRSSVAVPLLHELKVVGVFEFIGFDTKSSDEDLLESMSVIGEQITQFIARKQAESASERLKDDFFALVSHELRTPLTSVIGYTEMLAKTEQDRLSPRGMKFIDVIRRNAKREMRLVGDLLMLVRIEAGTFQIEPGNASIRELIAEAVEAAVPSAEKAGVTIIESLHDLPPFTGDPVRLGQVVDNLLSNAVKFTPEGGKVKVTLRQEGGDAVISVSDTGAGIPPEEQDKLFDRLYRATTATEEHIPGTGLGLTIVKAIIEAHGGKIELESEVGIGSTFKVVIPLASTPAPVAAPPVAPATAPAPDQAASGEEATSANADANGAAVDADANGAADVDAEANGSGSLASNGHHAQVNGSNGANGAGPAAIGAEETAS